MEDDKIADRATVCPTVPQEMRMNEQNSGPAEARQSMAEDTALQLFQIAALMLGDEQEAVSLVEEGVAGGDTGVRRGAHSPGPDRGAAVGRPVPRSVRGATVAASGRDLH